MQTADVTVTFTVEDLDRLIVRMMGEAGWAEGDIDAAIMQGQIGPLSRVRPPCSHKRWDENALAKVCLDCHTVLEREEPQR